MKDKLKEIQEALLTCVSYMLPFVISGGLLIAIGFLLGAIIFQMMLRKGATSLLQCSG